MNKKLLTAAIGAALAAGPMLAQADVKLYGKIHVSVDRVDGKGTGASSAADARQNTAVSSNASRWGIDVSEKLGGGMTAIGKIETEIEATNDGGESTPIPRNRYVGLRGKFGTVIGGVIDTPMKDIGRAVEFFPEYIGDARNLTRQNTTYSGQTSLGWDERARSAIRYTTPSFNGFALSYLYSADFQSSNTLEDNRRRADSLSLTYSKGPLFAGLAIESHKNPGNVVTTDAGSNESEKATRLTASYNFGALKVAGLWQDVKDLGGKAAGDAQGINRTTWGLGGAYTAGNNVFKLQYYKAGSLNKQSATTDTAADNTGAKMWALGWDHLFSKTAKAYVAYAKTDNDAAAAFTVNGGGHGDTITPGTGLDGTAWSIGMILDF